MDVCWADIPLEPNTELCFVCKIPKATAAELALAAKDTYNLYVNGKFVQYGPARAAKGYARVERVRLDEYLTETENRICVYVQSNYTKALNVAEERPLFGAELFVNGRLEKSTTDFCCYEMTDRVRKAERMSVQRGFVEVYRMQADREIALENFPRRALKRAELPVLLERGVSVSAHEHVQAVEFERGGVEIDATRLWQCPFTNLLDSGDGLFGYKRSECDCVVSKELEKFVFHKDEEKELRYASYSLGRTRCGKFDLTIRAQSEGEIWLIYDDILVDGCVRFDREQILHGMKWTLAAGTYRLRSQEVYSAQYITVVYKGQICVDEVGLICVENPDVANFRIDCKDETLQKIAYAAANSFAQNAYDIFTDCPSRERAGWLCDSYFMGEAEEILTGSHKVEKNFLENYLLYKNQGYYASDGVLPMCYPSEPRGENDYIPNWILWYVLQLERYQIRTGDKEFIRLHKQRAYEILDFFRGYENEYELLENLGGWVFVEWSRANDFTAGVNFPSNMLYAAAIAAVGRLFDDASLLEKSERIKANIKSLSFTDGLFVDNAVRVDGKLQRTQNVSETCQNYACFFSVATPQTDADFYRRFVTRFGALETPEKVCPSNMFIGYVLRLMVLLREGHYELLLQECKQTFSGMAERTGTLWELFAENASCNHGFGSIVAKLIADAETALHG